MKKLISILLVLLMLTALLVSCEGGAAPGGETPGGQQNGNTETPDAEKPDAEKPDDGKKPDAELTVYEKLNVLMDKGNYSTLTVTSEVASKDGVALGGEYVYTIAPTGTVIKYSVEKLGQIEIVDGVIVTPEDMVKTLVGMVIISDGEVVKQTGDALDVDFSNAKYPHFEFEDYYFASVTESEGTFEARVNSPSGFFGSQMVCTGMKVLVKYTEKTITDITVTYESESGSTVTLTYEYR